MGIYPLAVNMASLSQKAYDDARFENVAYFEPFYLKEFQATIAKNKVLNEALGKTNKSKGTQPNSCSGCLF